jgi:hypothetical protein
MSGSATGLWRWCHTVAVGYRGRRIPGQKKFTDPCRTSATDGDRQPFGSEEQFAAAGTAFDADHMIQIDQHGAVNLHE